MQSLWRLSREQEQLNLLLEESGGELTPEIETALAINEENFLLKAENYIATICKYKELANACKMEKQRVDAIKRTSEKIVDRMMESLSTAMKSFKYDKKNVGTYNLSFRRSEQVVIDNESLIPQRFIIVKTEISKTEIKEALKGGETVEGAHIQENYNLQIR